VGELCWATPAQADPEDGEEGGAEEVFRCFGVSVFRCFGVSVFRQGGVSVKRRDRNQIHTADLGKGQWFAAGFMRKLYKRENSYLLRFANEFRWEILAAAILRRRTPSRSGVFENEYKEPPHFVVVRKRGP